jgi:membrane fusion protein (multidrug efflux system)
LVAARVKVLSRNGFNPEIPVTFRPAYRALLVAAVIGSLAACEMRMPGGKSGGGDTGVAAFVPPEVVVPVETAPLRRGNIATYFETTSRVEAERKVDVAAKASARCEKILVEIGDAVTQGQVLAELERTEAEAAYAQSEVTVRQNKTAYELARQQFEEGLGPKVEMDNARYAYEQSLATLETQRIQLDNLTIRAPISGIVTQRDIQTGMLVSVGFNAFRIVDPTSYILTISPPERELPRLKVGQVAKVSVDALRGREFDAQIRRINPSVDPVSGTVKVVLDFDEQVRKSLHEAAFARVKLVMATLQNVLLAPKEAIVDEEGRQYLFLAVPAEEAEPSETELPRDGETEYAADRVEVRTGLEDSNRIQIINGASDGDVVITNGQHTLKPGTRIRITNLHDDIWQNADLSADEALAAARKRREEGAAAEKAQADKGEPASGR